MMNREPVDDEVVWSDRELVVAVERGRERGREEGRVEGWNAALEAIDEERQKRGGMARGGMGTGGEGDDLRRLVGERFATALEGVWVASLRYLRSTVPGDGGGSGGRIGVGKFRAGNGLTDRRLVMRGVRGSGGGVGGKRGVGLNVGGVVVDEAALAFKMRVDSKLRKITREMENWLENRSSNREENVVLRCKKCRRFAEEKWNYCPFDGQKME